MIEQAQERSVGLPQELRDFYTGNKVVVSWAADSPQPTYTVIHVVAHNSGPDTWRLCKGAWIKE